jgi:hypothetical protein
MRGHFSSGVFQTYSSRLIMIWLRGAIPLSMLISRLLLLLD